MDHLPKILGSLALLFFLIGLIWFAQRHVTGELSRRLRESGNRRLRLGRARKSSGP